MFLFLFTELEKKKISENGIYIVSHKTSKIARVLESEIKRRGKDLYAAWAEYIIIAKQILLIFSSSFSSSSSVIVAVISKAVKTRYCVLSMLSVLSLNHQPISSCFSLFSFSWWLFHERSSPCSPSEVSIDLRHQKYPQPVVSRSLCVNSQLPPSFVVRLAVDTGSQSFPCGLQLQLPFRVTDWMRHPFLAPFTSCLISPSH